MRIINKIPLKKLKELYWQQKISSLDIAKVYNCHPKTIRRWLKEYGIRIRTLSEARINYAGVEIPKEKLKNLYLNEKLTSSEVAKKFNCCQRTVLNKLLAYRIPIRTISEANALKDPRYPRQNFSGKLDEKAYIIGFRLGDLSAYKWNENSPTVYIHASSTKPVFIRLVKHLFCPYGHIWINRKRSRKGNLEIKCYLNKSFDFLLKKEDLIEPWILKKRNYFAAFLAGYADAEGCFCVSGRKKNSAFSINSQDKNILFQLYFKLNKMGVLCRPPRLNRKKGTLYKGIINNKDQWTLSVKRKDSLLKLIELMKLYSKHPEKQRKMRLVKESILERYKKYNIYQSNRWDKLYLKAENYVRS